MKSDLNDLKKLTLELMKDDGSNNIKEKNQGLIEKIYGENDQIEDSNNLDLQSDVNIGICQLIRDFDFIFILFR